MEKVIKENKKMFIAFVDLEKAYSYGTVSRGKLWKVLEEYTICGKLLTAIRALYDGSQACVRGKAECRSGLKSGKVSARVVCYPQCCSTYIHGQSDERGNGELEGRSTDADRLCTGPTLC